MRRLVPIRAPRWLASATSVLLLSGVLTAVLPAASSAAEGATSIPACAPTGTETITTDKEGYQPEDIVLVQGAGFAPSCDVIVRVTRPDGSVLRGDGSFTQGSDAVTTAADGTFAYEYILVGISGTYTVDAIGADGQVLASTTFLDSLAGTFTTIPAAVPPTTTTTFYLDWNQTSGGSADGDRAQCVKFTLDQFSGVTAAAFVSRSDTAGTGVAWNVTVLGSTVTAAAPSAGDKMFPGTLRIKVTATSPAMIGDKSWTLNAYNNTGCSSGAISRTWKVTVQTIDPFAGSGSAAWAGTGSTLRFTLDIVNNSAASGGREAKQVQVWIPSGLGAVSNVTATANRNASLPSGCAKSLDQSWNSTLSGRLLTLQTPDAAKELCRNGGILRVSFNATAPDGTYGFWPIQMFRDGNEYAFTGSVPSVTVATLTAATTGSGSVSSTVDNSANAGDGHGIVCPDVVDDGVNTCSAVFLNSASVTLTATPDTGWAFRNWTGACSGESPTCTVTMSEAKSVTAVFGRTFAVSITGSGSVASTTAGDATQSTQSHQIACVRPDTSPASSCSGVFLNNASVTLTATPDTGWAFRNWTGACSGESPTCTVTMSEARSVTAVFGRGLAVVGVVTEGSGYITSSSDPDPIGNHQLRCPDPTEDGIDTCAAVFMDGADVTLTATPDTTAPYGSPDDIWAFRNWLIDCTGESATCLISDISGAKSVKAVFGRTLTVSITGSGSVSSTDNDDATWGNVHRIDTCATTGTAACAAVFLNGDSVTLTATADTANGWAFRNWTGGGCSGESTTCTVTMSQARSVTAVFGYTLTVSITGPGSVASTTPSDATQSTDSHQISCVRPDTSPASTCSAVFLAGQSVTLTAAPGTNYELRNFAGDDDGNGAVDCSGTGIASTAAGVKYACTITMGGARTVKTYFGRELVLPLRGKGTVGVTFDASTPADADQPGTPTCDSRSADTTCYYVVLDGKKLDLAATGDTDYELRNFAGVECGAVSGSTSTNAGIARKCKVTMGGPRTTRTYFGRELRLDLVGSGTVSFSADATGDPDQSGTLSACDSLGSTTCYRVVLNGTVVTLSTSTATFAGWADSNDATQPIGFTGLCSEAGASCPILMTSPKFEKAYFADADKLWLRASAGSPAPAGPAALYGGRFAKDSFSSLDVPSGATLNYEATLTNRGSSTTQVVVVDFIRTLREGRDSPNISPSFYSDLPDSSYEDRPQLLSASVGATNITCTYVSISLGPKAGTPLETFVDTKYECSVPVLANSSATLRVQVSAPYYPNPTNLYGSGRDLTALFSLKTPETAAGAQPNDVARATVFVQSCGSDVCAAKTLAATGGTLAAGVTGTGSSSNTNATGSSLTSQTSGTVSIGSTADPALSDGSLLRTTTLGTTSTTSTTQPACTLSLRATCYTFLLDAPKVTDPQKFYTFRFYWDKSLFTDSTGKLLIDLRYVTVYHLPDGKTTWVAYPRCSTKITVNCISSAALLKGSGDLEIVVKATENGAAKFGRG